MQKVIDYLIKKNRIVYFEKGKNGFLCQMDGFEGYNDDEPMYYKTLDEIIVEYLGRRHAMACECIEITNIENEAKYYFCEGKYIPPQEEPDYDVYVREGKERLIKLANEYFE